MFLVKSKEFKNGYNRIISESKKLKNTMMNFGILQLKKGQSYENSVEEERAFLLLKGQIRLLFNNESKVVKRDSYFNESPICLHVPKVTSIKIIADTNAELAFISTQNEELFLPQLYDNVENEYRGKGTMQETSTRIVRTIFDKNKSPKSNMVLGEVVNYPGKWSSYPPHHHPQPEIYHYRFFPEQGFGLALLGDKAIKIENGDTVKILNDNVHPHTAAPGYVMYYIWVIRHLDGNPYMNPIFVPEHKWVMDGKALIWPERKDVQ
ncbi:MAG: 5-deoxy-glucuronate isomerase [Candidatus Parvarchaeota archaeon]|nr:5-deoxy-glucuronate isomerase [Candidatus Jingweiarchaeum tengchongense]